MAKCTKSLAAFGDLVPLAQNILSIETIVMVMVDSHSAKCYFVQVGHGLIHEFTNKLEYKYE